MATSYRDLIIWQKAMDLAEAVYALVKLLPKEETYALSDQMRRAAVSVPSNIAEGHKRNSDRDFKHFLSIANGSCAELETQLLLTERVGLLPNKETADVLSLCEEVQKMLHVFILKLEG